MRASLGAVGLLGVASAAQIAPVTGVPPIPTLGPMIGALLVASLPVAVPLGVLLGITGELRAARRDGRWEALAAMGRSPDRTLRSLVLGAGFVAGVLVVGEHLAFPWARVVLADLRVEAAVALAPGAALRLGDWTVTRDAAVERSSVEGDAPAAFRGGAAAGPGAVHAIAAGPTGVSVVSATSLTLVPHHGGTDVRLGSGSLRRGEGAEAVTLRFDTLAAVLPGSGRGRPVDARPTGSFQPRGPYETWIVLKRTLVPVLLVPLVVAAAALGVRGRAPSAWMAGGLVGSAWGLVRGLDGLVRDEHLGVGVAGAVLLGSAGLAAWVGRRALA